jgi:Family of unknown function (DUF6998)
MALSDDEIRDIFARFDDGELLALWGSLMSELNARGIVRSDNNPLGDYCEFLVAAHYGVKPEANSNAGYDVEVPDGERIQVKGRRLNARGRKPPHFSGMPKLDDEPPPFDLLIGLIINRDFSVFGAWQIPVERVRHYAIYNAHTHKWWLPTINRAMQDDPAIEPIQLRHAR